MTIMKSPRYLMNCKLLKRPMVKLPKFIDHERETIEHITHHFKKHPSIKEMKKYYFKKNLFIYCHFQKLLEKT